MSPEVKFGKWVAVGVPYSLVIVAICSFVIHLSFNISWQNIATPAIIFWAVQTCAYVCMFWARKPARERGKFGPVALLSGCSLWAQALIVLHYGKTLQIISADNDWKFLSVVMFFTTIISWIILAKFGPTLMKLKEYWGSKQDK